MQFVTKLTTVAIAAVTCATVAGAQVNVVGSTTGCFGAGCTNFSNAASFGIDGTGETVNFAGMSFSGETNPVTNGFTVGNFGTLVLVPAPSGTTPNSTFTTPFTLLFTLSAPAGSTSPRSSFMVTGFVGNTNGQGTRDISYTGASPVAFTFNGGTGTIQIDGGQIGVNATTISGRVTATASTVPEPSTYALLGVGMTGLVAVVRRRRAA